MPTFIQSRRSFRVFGVLPLALYLLLSVLYLLAIPPGESPDEPSHLQCVEQVALLNRIPIVEPLPRGPWWSRERVISGLTCYHLPLYYFMAGYTQKLLATVTGAPLHYEFPPTDARFASGASVAMFAHAEKTNFLAPAEPFTLTALRLESTLLGMLVLWATYRLTRRLAPTSAEAAILGMVLVAGWPQFVFMSRAINNDMLAVALAVAALAVLVGYDQPRRYILIGALSAAAILAKLTMAFAVVVAALGWVMEWRATSEAGLRRRLWRGGLMGLAILLALLLLLALHPTLRTNILMTIRSTSALNPSAQTIVYWQNVFTTTLQSGWGRFGWMNLATPDMQVYAWWGMLGISGLIGLIAVVRQADSASGRWRAVLLCAAWTVCVLGMYVRIQMNRFQPQFRYAFAIVPVLSAFAGIGLARLAGRSVFRQRLLVLLLSALLLAVNLWIVFAVLVPAYP